MLTVAVCLLAAAAASAAPPPYPYHSERPALNHEGLSSACGVATDSQGNLYVAREQSLEVKVYDQAGSEGSPPGSEITSFSAGGVTNPGYFPCDLAVDAAGDVYVSTEQFISGRGVFGREVVRYKPSSYPPSGETTYAPDTSLNTNGVLVSASHQATSVAVDPDSQRVYASEPLGNETQRLQFSGFATGDMFKLTANGEETAAIEYTGSNGTRKTNIENALLATLGAGNVSLTSPNFTVLFEGALANTDISQMTCETTSGAGTCEVSEEFDGSTTNVSSFEPDGTPISSTIGEGLVSGADFFGVDVYAETGNVYVTDRAHSKAYVLNPAGDAIEAEIDGSEAPEGPFGAMEKPFLAVDQSNGHVLVSDVARGVVDEFTEAGGFLTEIAHEPAFTEDSFAAPNIAVDNGTASSNQGNVYVSSANGNAYAYGPYHPELPDLDHEGLSSACGVATDSQGNLYVAREQSLEVKVYDQAGSEGSPPGSEITSFSAGGVTNPGYFPCDLAVDAAGDVYVSTEQFISGRGVFGREVVRYKPSSYPPSGETTYAPDTSLNTNGVLVSASHQATSVAVDPDSQRVYASEPLGNETQRLQFSGFATGDMFKLTANGEETAAIEYTGSNGTRKTNIENALLATLGAGNVSLTSPNFTVLFEGALANTDISQMTCETTSGAGTCEVSEEFDGSTTNVSSFEPDGTPISSTIGEGLVSGADFFGVDVYAETGNVYVTDRAHSKAYVLNPAGDAIEAEIDGSEAPEGPFGAMEKPFLAVDQSNGHVLVSDVARGVVDEFTEAGGFLTEIAHEPAFTEDSFAAPNIAVDNGTASSNQGNVYVSSANGNAYAYGPLPGGKPQYPLTVEKHGAGSGTVTSLPPGISCGTACEAEFLEGKEVTLSAAADLGSEIADWSGCESVSEDKTKCTVVIETATTVGVTFDSRPVIGNEAVGQVTATSVQLSAAVNPKGKTTSYQFEYITEAAWQANGESFSEPEAAAKAPAAPVELGSGFSPLAVGVKVEGLEPFTAYRFRAVASNEIGSADGERNEADEEIQQRFTTYSVPQVFDEPCGNDDFRKGASALLPDCRAWEQASPIDKNEGNVQGTAPNTRASESGGAISFESAAGIPGGAGSQAFPSYFATRGANGWTTTGLLPGATAGQRAKVLGWTPDFTTVFDEVERFGHGNAMVARSVADGSQLGLSPYTTPVPSYSYLGASKDGTTVIFQASDTTNTSLQLAPEAAAGKNNVYAVDRGEPESLWLAGVLPDGSVPAQGTRAGFGGDYAYDTNRVGANGEVYFEDLETGQLYLRLNPTEDETTETKEVEGKDTCVPDPVLACTIHISASQKTNGKGVEKHDAAGSQPAKFVAASSDGSRVTFLSSEKLTDDATTGPEPDGPAIGRAVASDGSEQDNEFRPGQPGFAKSVAVDEAGGYIYWADPAHHRIGRSELDGGDFTENFIATPSDEAKNIAGEAAGIAVVDEGAAKYIFWTDAGELGEEGNPQVEKGTIGRADLDGGNVNQECLTKQTNPRSIAADSSYIYWTNPGVSPIEKEEGVGLVARASLECDQLSVEPEFIGDFGGGGDIAITATHIYTSKVSLGFETGIIYKFNIDGTGNPFEGGFPVLISGDKSLPGLAADASYLYWTNPTASHIGRHDLGGGGTEYEFITEAGHPGDLAVDDNHLYWTANQGFVANAGTDLYQLERDSGELVDLAPDGSHENGIGVQGVLGTSRDGSYVYFAANGVPDDLGNSPNEAGEIATPGNCKGAGDAAKGICNLYVAHAGGVQFIARLDAEGVGLERDAGDALNWIASHSETSKSDSDRTARVSGDGRVLLFRSRRKLTEYDNGGPTCAEEVGSEVPVPGLCAEFYRFDFDAKSLACVSCDPRGEAPTGSARLASLLPPTSRATLPAAVLGRNLSRDGKRIFFETPDALVARDTNGEKECPAWGSSVQQQSSRACQDVYEWEAPEKGSCSEASPAYAPSSGGCIYLISTGKSGEASFFADADLEGRNAFIFTYERLVGQDKDGLLDVYDARSEGGLAAQGVAEAVPCAGEACKPRGTAPPALPAPGSAGFTGPAESKPKRHGHKKHKHRKHRRQRRAGHPRKGKHKKKRPRRHKHQTAKTSGRAGR